MIKEGELSKFLLFWILSTLVLLLIIEVILRLAGYPRGIFLSSYPTNSKLEMTWGQIPYTIETNSLGLRSHEITPEKKPGVFRILALGDSITEGYFVDNQDTYPQLLEDELNGQGIPTEVINTGMGGGSIDKEFAMFRKIAYLAPDVAILTFVTNDIAEIRYKPKGFLINTSLSDFRRQTAIRSWFITHTATGEAIYDWYLTWKYQSYKAAERQTSSEQRKNRYQIEGGDDYIANAQEFNQRYIDTDGLVLTSPFSAETLQLIENYNFALEHLNNFAQNNNIKVVLVYFPSYSQIYDMETSLEIRDVLQEEAQALSIPFLDLTPAFRAAGQNQVLHLAPIDFHLNPVGNRIMAQAIAEFLMNEGFVAVDRPK